MHDIRYQVFVSSTYRDLIEHRQKVINALMSVNAIPAGMELFPSADDGAWEIIKRTIDQSDYYVVIIGGKYGSVDDEGKSYTEKEYDYAATHGVPIMAFIHEDPEELKGKNLEHETDAREKLEIFKSKVKGRHCNFWRDANDLVQQVLASFFHMTINNPRPGWIRGSEARTIEDAEYLAKLEKRNNELEQMLSKYNSDQKLIEDTFKEMENDLDIPIYYWNKSDSSGKKEKTLFGTYKLSFLDLFSSIKDLIVDGTIEHQISNFLLDMLVAEHNLEIPNKAENANAKFFISADTIDSVRRFLAIRNIIETEITETPSRHFGMHKKITWQITDFGKKLVLHMERFEEQVDVEVESNALL